MNGVSKQYLNLPHTKRVAGFSLTLIQLAHGKFLSHLILRVWHRTQARMRGGLLGTAEAVEAGTEAWELGVDAGADAIVADDDAGGMLPGKGVKQGSEKLNSSPPMTPPSVMVLQVQLLVESCQPSHRGRRMEGAKGREASGRPLGNLLESRMRFRRLRFS